MPAGEDFLDLKGGLGGLGSEGDRPRSEERHAEKPSRTRGVGKGRRGTIHHTPQPGSNPIPGSRRRDPFERWGGNARQRRAGGARDPKGHCLYDARSYPSLARPPPEAGTIRPSASRLGIRPPALKRQGLPAEARGNLSFRLRALPVVGRRITSDARGPPPSVGRAWTPASSPLPKRFDRTQFRGHHGIDYPRAAQMALGNKVYGKIVLSTSMRGGLLGAMDIPEHTNTR